jgi:hypothetical protein
MSNIDRIQRTSKRLKLVCTILFIGIPVLTALFWIFFNSLSQNFLGFGAFASKGGGLELPIVTRLLALMVNMIPVSVIMYSLFILIRLSNLYKKKSIFSYENVKCYRKLGYTLLIWVVAGIIYDVLIGIVFTIGNPPGKRSISVMFTSIDLTALIVGYVIIIISRVIDEGRKLEEEQKFTI